MHDIGTSFHYHHPHFLNTQELKETHMFALIGLTALTHIFSPTAPLLTAVAPVIRQHEVAVDPAMDMAGKLVGGTWITVGDFHAEFKYEWRIKGKALRGVGIIAKGTKEEMPSEALYGWDAEKKKVYYMDFHGASTVYKGECSLVDNKFVIDFMGLVGDTGHYMSDTVFTDTDTFIGTIYSFGKDGKPVKLHSLTFKRHK